MNKSQKYTFFVLMALAFLWMQVLLPWLYKKNNWKNPNDPAPTAQNASGSTKPDDIAKSNGALHVVATSTAASKPSTITIGSFSYDETGKKNAFPLGVNISTNGASIESVVLNRFRKQYNEPSPYIFQKRYEGQNTSQWDSLATRAVIINGKSAALNLNDEAWTVESPAVPATGELSSVAMSVTIHDKDKNDKPQIKIIKTFEIQKPGEPGAGYELKVSYKVVNLSGEKLDVKLKFNGPTAPESENSRDMAEVVAGFDLGNQAVEIQHVPALSVKEEQATDVIAMKEKPMLWSGMTSAYFDALIRPTDVAGNSLAMQSIKAYSIKTGHAGIEYETLPMVLDADKSSEFVLNVFLAPKRRDILKSDYYVNWPRAYNETLVLKVTSGFGAICGFCTFSGLIEFLVTILRWFHSVFRDWGLAIIGLVCLVRLLLHPISKKSQVQMSRMSKLGPEMEKLKAKFKDDPEGLKRAQFELTKSQGFAPILGCLPMFLQMPIWIALWSSLQTTFELRHTHFLYGFTWIKDLSQPDRLIHFTAFTIPWFNARIDGFNILPFVMAGVSYFQQKMMPQPVATTPEAQMQQKMMKYMSIVMFPMILYSQPSGLNVYMITSALLGIIESKRIRDHIKEEDDRRAQGLVIVDADPKAPNDLRPGQVRRAGSAGKDAKAEKPTTGFSGFMARIQEKAEEAMKERDRQLKKGNKKK